MELEKRVENLEKLVNSMIKTINNNKFYTDADINGTRQSVNNVTPYVLTQIAYIGDTAVDFIAAPKGNKNIYIVDEAGNVPSYQLSDLGDRIRITFESLEHITTITLVISQIKEEQR